MVAGLAMLTRLESLRIHFQIPKFPPEQRTGHLDHPMQVVLPALIEFYYKGCGEYLEDFVAQLDAPRLDDAEMSVDRLDSFRLPQLSMFIARTEAPKFRHARVDIGDQAFNVELKRSNRAYGKPAPVRARFSLSPSFEWTDTRTAYLAHVLRQIFAMFPNLGHLDIHCDDRIPGWEDHITTTEWLAFLHLFTTLEVLDVSGWLARQVARALGDIPGETVTEVLPSLHLLWLNDNSRSYFEDHETQQERRVESLQHFASLREFYGLPVTVVDVQTKKVISLAPRDRGLEAGT
ncbi:hypothetical protein EDB83DRAFT_2448356 [Lactarius deliciosus]|nr:hypothetical protein EDB83DRAFT_2497796 [Lactarius deliciosus]KAH9011547.1 hypothetical protein EDB83DRAFT_2448356 [Lactarius deliciosus]